MPSESDRKGSVRDWLIANGLVPEEEFETGDGPIDLYLGGRRVLIETKRKERLKNGPFSPSTGSKGNESAFEQLSRYVIAERRREKVHLDEEPGDQWIGCITDSERWWVWWWPPYGLGDKENAFPEFQGIVPDDAGMERLAKRFRRIVGKEWAPADPTGLFSATLVSLQHLYAQRSPLRATRTQQALWFEQLKAGGNAPESDENKIFVIHTMLILISRLVSETTGGDGPITEGFVQWVPDDGPEIMALREIVNCYDWRQRTGDVLRALYMGYIPREHRRVFGEYFTPDWTAEMICGMVIDDRYVSEQINRYQTGQPVQGVLDPTCGSGTFLYHAANFILESKAVRKSYMKPHEKTAFVSRMIRGMDIHPVAVEMAKANIHRLLPRVQDDDIWIYQGDALLTQRAESRFHSLMGGDYMALFSPGNRPLILPRSFLGDIQAIDKFVKSASDDVGMPPGLGHGLAAWDMEQLRMAHDQMREIIRKESNGVWTWYIRNQAAPILLKEEKVGRIVSNPPWPRINEIPVEARKQEIKGMAKERGLWRGGDTATSFSIAALFVDRCSDMYLTKSGKSGWLLQHGALFSGGWDGLRAKMKGRITGKWNLKRVPFKDSPSCAMFFGIDTPNMDLVKKPRMKINDSESWSTVESKIDWVEWQEGFSKEPSMWLENKGRRATARQGATLVPHCFVRIKTKTVEGDSTVFETMQSQQNSPWTRFGTQHGTVPSRWVTECLFFPNLMPYLVPTTTSCILPMLRDGRWDPDRQSNRYWQDVTDMFANNHSPGFQLPQDVGGKAELSQHVVCTVQTDGAPSCPV